MGGAAACAARRAVGAAMLAGNLMLALAWVAMSGHFSILNLTLGLAFGYIVILASQRPWVPPPTSASRRCRYASRASTCGGRPRQPARRLGRHDAGLTGTPGIVAIPLEARSDAEIMLLTNLISMTPGSLSLDVSADRRCSTCMPCSSMTPSVPREIKQELERRVLEVAR